MSVKTFNLGKVRQHNFTCVVDVTHNTKESAMNVANKVLNNAGFIAMAGLEGIPENYVVNVFSNDLFALGVHAQKYRRNKNHRGYWRVRFYIIEDWEDKIVIQHKRHFDVYEIKKA